MNKTTENTVRIQYQSKLYELPYTLIRSDRRSCSISIDADGAITVRVPLHISEQEISRLLIEKRLWIIRKYLETEKRRAERPVSDLTDAQRAALTRRYIAAAKEYFPKRVEHYIQLTGGSYERIAIWKLQQPGHSLFQLAPHARAARHSGLCHGA